MLIFSTKLPTKMFFKPQISIFLYLEKGKRTLIGSLLIAKLKIIPFLPFLQINKDDPITTLLKRLKY
jgi:hypothetical protein